MAAAPAGMSAMVNGLCAYGDNEDDDAESIATTVAYRSKEEYGFNEGGRADPLLAPALYKKGNHTVAAVDSYYKDENGGESDANIDEGERLEEQVAEDGVLVGQEVRRVGGLSQLSCWATLASGARSQAKSNVLAMPVMNQIYQVEARHRLKRLAFKIWQFVAHRWKRPSSSSWQPACDIARCPQQELPSRGLKTGSCACEPPSRAGINECAG